MATQKTPLNVANDELGRLIISSNNGPIPWGQQQKLVELFMEYIEKKEQTHLRVVDRLDKIIRNYEEIKQLKKGS